MNILAEKSSICSELQNIINELNDIANGVQSDFEGIGSEHCVSKIRNISSALVMAKGKLQKMDINKLAASSDLSAYGGGDGGHRF